MNKLIRKHFNLADVPRDLHSLVTIDRRAETDPRLVGMSDESRERIWDSVIALYRTGTQPAIQFTLRRGGKVLMQRAVGHAQGNGPHDAGVAKVPVDTNTPFCYFSASKAVTAFLMHVLAEQGLINLMDPVSYYLPEFAQNGKANITIHQILAHRGGIPGLPTNVPMDTLWDVDKIWELLCAAKPITVDGAKLAYHAITGGYVLGRVVEKVTGASIQTYLDQTLRQPLGMRYFTYGLPTDEAAHLATNYATGPMPHFPVSWVVRRALGADLPVVEQVINDARFMQTVIPAGNLAGTAEEMSRFYQMLLNGGEWEGSRICSPLTVRRLIQEFGGLAVDRTMMIPMRYSAGLMLGGEPFGIWGPHSKDAFGHIGLINKWCWADARRDMSVSLLTSGLPIVSHHLPVLAKFVMTVCQECGSVPEHQRPLRMAMA